MREQFEDNQANFDDLVDKWEKAQQKGIFADAPKPATPTPTTADHSFFGLQTTNPTSGPSEIDAKYWDAIYRASSSDSVDEEPPYMAGEVFDDHILQEEKKRREYPPNPVSVDSGGMDQEMTAQALGQTFDEEDIKALEEMKLKLYELESKIAGAVGKGDSVSKFESQINTLKKKIDDLSTQMSYSFPTDIA